MNAILSFNLSFACYALNPLGLRVFVAIKAVGLMHLEWYPFSYTFYSSFLNARKATMLSLNFYKNLQWGYLVSQALLSDLIFVFRACRSIPTNNY
jgi:hypothetical protein